MLDPGRRAESTSSGALASAAISRGATELADAVGDPPAHGAVRLQAAGGGRDQRDARDPLGEQLRVPLGEGDDRHATHRVADQDDLALRRDRLDHARRGRRRAGRWWRARGRDALRAAVRALVVEHHPVLAAERLALEVPAVEVEGVAVHEDQRHVVARLAATRGLRVGVRRHLVDLGVQHHAVVAGDLDRRRSAARRAGRPARRRPDGP